GKARAAAAKKAAGEPVTGLPSLLELVGMQACEKRIRSWLGLAAGGDAADRLPPGAIDVGNIDHAARANQIEALLISKGMAIFRQGAELVRVRKLDSPQGSRQQGTWRHEGL